MPYLVIVWTKDKHRADQVVRRYHPDSDTGRAVGQFWFPSMMSYCRCARRSGWTRDKSSGLMVCPMCKFPPRHHYDHIGRNLFHTLGKNLISSIVPHRFRSGYKGW